MPPRRRLIRFSLANVLFAVLCISGWLTGYHHGYRAGDASWKYKKIYVKAYSVVNLAVPVPDLPVNPWPTAADFEPLLSVLRKGVDPNQEFDADIRCSPSNSYIVVLGNGIVHRRVDDILAELRKHAAPELYPWAVAANRFSDGSPSNVTD